MGSHAVLLPWLASLRLTQPNVRCFLLSPQSSSDQLRQRCRAVELSIIHFTEVVKYILMNYKLIFIYVN